MLDLEKLQSAGDLRLHRFSGRASTLAKQHRPLVAFVLFAAFVLLCRQLPWGQNFPSTERYSAISYNQTLPPGGGTIEYLPSNNSSKPAKFCKVAVASGFEDILYEKALDTHVAHAARHGYPMYIARENAADGMFNKIAYILTVLLNELFKPAEERVEWIFYFDADSVLMNIEIPLEIFIPPSDFNHINWIAGKDHNGLNAGVFLLRVNQWSLNLLNRVMTHKHYHPDEDYTFEEQSILARLTENDDQFKKEMIYVPKNWFNAYFYMLNEVKPGLLLSHFPHPNYKWHIYEWLHVVESDQQSSKPVYNVPVHETDYPKDIKAFWNAKRRVDKVLKGFQRNVDRGADPIVFGLEHEETKELATQFRDKAEELKKAAMFKTDDPSGLEQMITETEESNAKLISMLMNYFETHENPPSIAGF